MIKYRLKFKKFGRLRFIGHLDLLNVFQRAINRANLPISYSKGFNPHQQMSFALPLTLGFYSEGEYLDLEFQREIGPEIIVAQLNKALPEGLTVISVRKFYEGEKSAAALTAAADYEVILPEGITVSGEDIENFLNQKSILVMKKGKKKTEEIDIRPDIFKLSAEGQKIYMLIAAGSMRNLKAETVVQALIGCEHPQGKLIYKRINLYKSDKAGFSDL